MRNPDFIIKIAADSIEKLRSIDVFRVLENCSDEELEPTAQYITAARPDLTATVAQDAQDIAEEREDDERDENSRIEQSGRGTPTAEYIQSRQPKHETPLGVQMADGIINALYGPATDRKTAQAVMAEMEMAK